MLMCREMGSCTEYAFLVSVSSGEALTGLTYAYRFVRRNELLMRFGIAPVSNKFTSVRFVPAITRTEMRTL